MNIFNNNLGNKKYFLDQNSSIGLPLNYYDYDPNTYFIFSLLNNNSNYTNENYSINERSCLNPEQKKYLKKI